ncbi:adenylate/guanylate cyclase domain-containing protein [Rhodopseudomonas pseudopalustris]|uniref:adenylate/guanylate cyclase domain-containing protein n=1 Tax=Rhodopseudomonas pseudopalustris TaxID=1513892 RepID=UPI00111332D4|nr:adenylate/guanylate cyclase domain-containing protein [Rhodopseudomonas pseudopalustris]
MVLIQLAAFVLILLIVAPLPLSYVENARGYPATRIVLEQSDKILKTVSPFVRQTIPTRIGGKDQTVWILVAGLLASIVVVGAIRGRVQRASMARQVRRQVAAWKRDLHIADNSKAALELDRQIKRIGEAPPSSRSELLKIFADTKKKLDAWGREMAFLAIDVVGSTSMKETEDKAAVQYDFIEYRKLVEEVFKSNGVLKSTWTPDGVMACFSSVDEAVAAGKDVIRGLAHFNANVRLMKREFAVRCGVNAGYVHFDPDTPLEQMSDRIIDIAGHMQKYAEPNTVAVARMIVEPLRDTAGFQPTEKVVDGYEVLHWTPTAG